jgi:RNA polymerase sigma-70 factor (ECF subfamily)
MIPLDQQALAQAAAGGTSRDEQWAAFSILVSLHKDRLFQIIRRMTGDDDAALDLLQDVFANLWRARGQYDAAYSFGAWATRTAINRVRDWRRRRRVRQLVAGWLPLVDAPDPPDPAPLPDASAADRQRLNLVAAAIARLPTGLSAPLLLTSIDGLSHAEAAALLGLSRKAVELRIARARKQILAEIGPD